MGTAIKHPVPDRVGLLIGCCNSISDVNVVFYAHALLDIACGNEPHLTLSVACIFFLHFLLLARAAAKP